MDNPHIIGLTGSFGSGCSYIGQHILRDKCGYDFLSLSEHVLRPLFKKQTGKEPDQAERRELQKFGDRIRSENGADHLVRPHVLILGYSRLSFRRASSILNCQSTPRCLALVFCDQVAISD